MSGTADDFWCLFDPVFIFFLLLVNVSRWLWAPGPVVTARRPPAAWAPGTGVYCWCLINQASINAETGVRELGGKILFFFIFIILFCFYLISFLSVR